MSDTIKQIEKIAKVNQLMGDGVPKHLAQHLTKKQFDEKISSKNGNRMQMFHLYKQEIDELRFENKVLQHKLEIALAEAKPGCDTIDQLLQTAQPEDNMQDPKTIKDANDCQVDILRTRLQHYDNDIKRAGRLKLQLCRCCAYLESEMGTLDINLNGEYTCMTCLQEHTQNVPLNTPKHCLSCAVSEHICCQCGSEMD